MEMKFNHIVLILVVTVLIFSEFATADGSPIQKPAYKRVIADNLDEKGIKQLEDFGCVVRHRLKKSDSFNCPESVMRELSGVREARVFYILDLQADQQIKANQVWADGVNGSGVNVVILDTGIDASHPELADSLRGQKDFVNNDNIAEDDNGHGTHVAGIITANGGNVVNGNQATGVAPGAGIYMLKVCDSHGICYEDDMMAAMEYAVNSLDAKVMSISIGGGNYGSHCDTDPLAAKANWVVDNGVTVVIAAGNDGRGVSSPACASKAIAVAAADKSGVIPYWSNRGTALDITAPGVNILSTYPASKYATMSGTSMATPHISGVVALLLSSNPTPTGDKIKQAMYSTATPATKCYACSKWAGSTCRTQTIVACTPDVQGAGIVDAYAAYLQVNTPASTTTTTTTVSTTATTTSTTTSTTSTTTTSTTETTTSTTESTTTSTT
jgi:subtilisin family serine protease